jgi:hypothetical protein
MPISYRVPCEPRGSVPVSIQDQTSPAILVYVQQEKVVTTLAANATENTNSITVTSTTGIIIDQGIVLFNVAAGKVFTGEVIGIVGNVLELDTPLNFSFRQGDTIKTASFEMNVDGSVTPQYFGLRGADPGFPLEIDINRIHFECLASNAVTLSSFGDIAGGLEKGLVLRKLDGEIINIFNVKTNQQIQTLCGVDFIPWSAINPVQGQNGFAAQFTLNGQANIGVTERVSIGEDLQFVIQDDLSDLLLFRIMVQGHIVTDQEI